MKTPGFGEMNFGAMAGLAVGSVGGLFILGSLRALVNHNLSLLIDTPILSLISWLVCGAAGWVAGGQVGPRVANRFPTRRSELIGGALGGLVPVLLVGAWGWYMLNSN